MAVFFNTSLKIKICDSFESLDEQLEFIAKKPIAWENNGSNKRGNRGFNGTDSFDEAIKLARYGWPEGLKNISEVMEETTKLINPYQCANNYLDIGGAYPNVPAACAGEINNMVNFNAEHLRQKPVIKLLINSTTGASTNCEQIKNRGAAILGYVDRLESAGYPLEIEVYDMGVGSGRSLFVSRVIVKHAGAHLDIDRLALVLAHPSYLRRIGFRMREIHPELQNDFSCGYGSMNNFDTEDLKKLNLGLHVHFPYLNGGYHSLEQSISHVKQEIKSQLTKQGYELPALMAEEGTVAQQPKQDGDEIAF